MTSLGVQEELTYHAGGPYCFKIQGQLHHKIGALLPQQQSDTPRFAQLWILDPEEALRHRQELNPQLNHDLLLILNEIIFNTAQNPFVRLYSSACEIFRKEAVNNDQYKIRLVLNESVDLRRYNLPTTNEIAVLIPFEVGEQPRRRDIILRYRGGGLQQISDISPLYLPLHYVLLCPRGEPG